MFPITIFFKYVESLQVYITFFHILLP